MKKEIEEAIIREDVNEAMQLIRQYEAVCPNDFEIASYYVSCYLLEGNVERAVECAAKAVKINPFDVEANYNYAVCLEMAGKYADAYDFYLRTLNIQNLYQVEFVPSQELNQRLESFEPMAENDEELRKMLYNREQRQIYALKDPFKDYDYPIIGTTVADNNGQDYYVGRCDGWFEAYIAPERNKDVYTTRCELFPIAEYTNDFSIDAKEPLLLPVALNPVLAEEKLENYIFERGSIEKVYFDSAACKYSYIPVTGKVEFHTGKPAVFGKPIPLKMNRNTTQKRLVLNLFIDSFNERIIEEYGLENIMPNTAKFFSKGIRCEQYYSCSEFTLPSIGTYWTGKYPTHHMNVDERIRYWFMNDEKNFTEYFKDAGYTTAKIGGNWSVTPAQGYIRGMDRCVYQFASAGLTVKEVVSDAIEHIDTFKNSNQFLWLEFLDLHEVAGGFMRSIHVQSRTPLEDRVIDNKRKSTVKQSRSHNMEKIYVRELAKMDLYLGILFDYIEKNYSDEDIVVSLFSDHGTAFMVDDDQPFASWQRTNIPLMIRDGKANGICNEIIQTTDYAGIICKLAGIDYDYSGTDANLPVVFGGQKEREYALSQSLFVGDPYQAGIHGKNVHCYFKTVNPVENAFRIDMKDCQIWAVDDEGNDITEETDTDTYKDVIMSQIAHLLKHDKFCREDM